MTPGRQLIRTRTLCEGCGARRTIGDPKSTDVWPQRLVLTEQQVGDLLQAAAEYRDLCEEASVVETAVEFVDWMSVDALRSGPISYAADGKRDRHGRVESGESLPFVSLPRLGKGKVA